LTHPLLAVIGVSEGWALPCN